MTGLALIASADPGGCGCDRDWIEPSGIGLRAFNALRRLDEQRWLALGPDCLQLSEDKGDHWTDLFCLEPSIASEQTLTRIQVSAPGTIWLLQGWSTLWHTTDAGQHWRNSTFGDKIIRGISLSGAGSGWLFGELSTVGDPDVRGFAMSTDDAGQSWRDLSLEFAPDYRWRVEDLAPAPDDTLWMIADLLYFSRDQGAGWQPATIDRQQWYELANRSVAFASKTFGWVDRSPAESFFVTLDQGQSWHLRKPPKGVRQIDDLLFIDDRTLFLAAGALYCSRDQGETWQVQAPWSSTSAVAQIEAISVDEVIISGGGGDPWIAIGRCRR